MNERNGPKRNLDDERLRTIIAIVAVVWTFGLLTLMVVGYLFDHSIDLNPTTIGLLIAGGLAWGGIKVIPGIFGK